MWFRTLFDSVRGERSRTPGSQRRRASSRRLISMEPLENRNLLAAVLRVSDVQILEGNSGVQQAAVVVSLSEPHGNSVTVNYRSVDGSATAGSDYTAVSGKLTFAKGQNSKTVLVPVRGDRSAEPDEQFSVVLSNAKGAKVVDGTGIVSIQDNEPRVSISDVGAHEGNSGTTPFKFTISLSAESDLPVTVSYATANGSATAGSDYTAASGTYTFAPGQTSKEIEVAVSGDREIEANETFVVNVSSSDAQVSQGVGSATIVDDEPLISISDSYYYVGYGEASFTFSVNLSVASDEIVTVDYATADYTALDGIDYVGTSGTLTFLPGVTSLTFTVNVLNPSAVDQYFFVQLSNASANASIAYAAAIGYWYYDYGYGGGYDYGYYDYGYYYY